MQNKRYKSTLVRGGPGSELAVMKTSDTAATVMGVEGWNELCDTYDPVPRACAYLLSSES